MTTTVEQLIEPVALNKLASEAFPNVDLKGGILDYAEPFDVRWQPWRGSVASILRLGDDNLSIGDFALLVCRRVSQFSYRTEGRFLTPSFRAIGKHSLAVGDGIIATLDLARGESVSFECEGVVLVTGQVSKPGHPDAYPDYSEMDEAYLSTLQQSWDYAIDPVTFTSLGKWS
ncbi:hypothetical protein HDC94_002566 [Leifsonia sp. AK011]|uniref:hypothetical protein n=1 Tax=Leifsonia sp. AK011 TaxID=2723075 RepID=UPI0015C7D9A3|nr:hypothetical protein [Leifsonia sp. AK011]NYF11410.1 hypothetical protein [Leifsonia sp. AK011]